MLNFDDIYLVGLIIHELTHNTVYKHGFPEFNESIATFYEREGTLLYIEKALGEENPIYEYAILDQFYETTMGTVHLNNNEQNELLTKTGFKDIQRMPIGKGMFDFISAVK